MRGEKERVEKLADYLRPDSIARVSLSANNPSATPRGELAIRDGNGHPHRSEVAVRSFRRCLVRLPAIQRAVESSR